MKNYKNDENEQEIDIDKDTLWFIAKKSKLIVNQRINLKSVFYLTNLKDMINEYNNRNKVKNDIVIIDEIEKLKKFISPIKPLKLLLNCSKIWDKCF